MSKTLIVLSAEPVTIMLPAAVTDDTGPIILNDYYSMRKKYTRMSIYDMMQLLFT